MLEKQETNLYRLLNIFLSTYFTFIVSLNVNTARIYINHISGPHLIITTSNEMKCEKLPEKAIQTYFINFILFLPPFTQVKLTIKMSRPVVVLKFVKLRDISVNMSFRW